MHYILNIRLITNKKFHAIALTGNASTVSVAAGELIMHDAAHDLTVTGGTATVVNVANDVSVNKGTVTQTGTVGGILDVSNGGLYLGGAGADVAGVVTINTANAKVNKLNNAALNVTLTVGKLTMNDATGNASTVSVAAGELIMNNAGNDLTVTGGKATVNDVAKNVSVNNAAKVIIKGDVGGNIDGNINSTITFSGGTTSGNVAQAKNIVIAGDYTFNKAFSAVNLQINGDHTVSFIGAATDIGGIKISTTKTNKKQNFDVYADQTITAEWGSAANSLGALNVNAAAAANRTITLNTDKFYAGITGEKTNVVFNHAAGSSVSYLGTDVQSINNANFAENGKVFGEVHAGTTHVRDNKTAKFNHKVFNTELTMYGAAARAEFAEQVKIDNMINADANGNGILDFKKGAILNSHIGSSAKKQATTTFGGDTTISADIHSNVIKFANKLVTLNRAATFDGSTTFDGTTLNLAQNDLTLKGGNATIKGKTVINTTLDGNDIGNLVAGVGTKISMDAGAAIKINLAEGILHPTCTEITLIKKDGGTLNLDISRITVVKAGRFSSWTDTITDKGLVLTQKTTIEK